MMLPLTPALWRAVIYADIFDQPLTLNELHRYLEIPATHEAVAAALPHSGLEQHGAYITLPQRGPIVAIRRQREHHSARHLSQAQTYSRVLARLPFIRSVLLTGTLAAQNSDADSDIDYLIITAPGRLWVGRAFVILLVRYAAQRGITLCPNYFISTRALAFAPRNLYVARELLLMQPLAGWETYRALCAQNDWTRDFFPNAAPYPERESGGGLPWAWVEHALATPLGTRLEHWEMHRKLRKFTAQGLTTETLFTPDVCKGHFDNHGTRILQLFEERVKQWLVVSG